MFQRVWCREPATPSKSVAVAVAVAVAVDRCLLCRDSKDPSTALLRSTPPTILGNKPGARAVLVPMMNGSARFPHLALPFAIVGASAGWLAAGLFANPLFVRMKSAPALGVTVIAAGVAAATGSVITRFCKGDHDRYRIDDGSRAPRASLDRWTNHAGAVLVGGVLAGALSAGIFDAYHGPAMGALGGLAAAAAFVPVCLTVVAAARRAQRARMGSLVAGSDRRAVWGILAMALSAATLWGLPLWASAAAGDMVNPWPAAIMLVGAGLSIAIALGGDTAAMVRARQALSKDLLAKDASEVGATDTRVPRVDLGLGSDLAAEVTRPNSAYRGRDKTVALVIGSPKLAVSALRRAMLRGALGLGMVAGIAGIHWYAASSDVQRAFDERRCESFDYKACGRAAGALREQDPVRAAELYSKACGRSSSESCVEAARLYEEGVSRERDPMIWRAGPNAVRAYANEFYQRACRYGDRAACSRSRL